MALGANRIGMDRSPCAHPELILIRNDETRKITIVQCEDCGAFVACPDEMEREDHRETWRRFLASRGIVDEA
jgi:uncharacterized OB-fold protein